MAPATVTIAGMASLVPRLGSLSVTPQPPAVSLVRKANAPCEETACRVRTSRQPEAGHFPWMDRPDRFRELVAPFLDD
jgi:pimeloyl-ACP methyl ester carboxylesterase